MHIATRTLAAIETAIYADQGARYRQLLREYMPLADDAYRAEESEFRAHLGASIIGRDCTRELWYSFHWATSRKTGARMLRLWNRGHLEEPRMLALLAMIGCTLYHRTPEGKQYRMNGYRGHYGGGIDAVVVGCPDIPDRPVLGEFKTYNQKQFDRLKEGGMMTAHWEHFVQTQQYMGAWNLDAALYLATCKNTDELHAELIQFDPIVYQKYQQRAADVIDARDPPPRISNTPGFFKCKFCDHSATCHLNATPARNCRTCLHSAPADNGEWVCQHPVHDQYFGDNVPLSEADQLLGCEDYEVNPSINA